MNKYTTILIFLGLAWMVISSATDLDWMVVSYRYSEWHRQQETWEFNPHHIWPWWIAYMYTYVKGCLGWFLLGWYLRNKNTSA